MLELGGEEGRPVAQLHLGLAARGGRERHLEVRDQRSSWKVSRLSDSSSSFLSAARRFAVADNLLVCL